MFDIFQLFGNKQNEKVKLKMSGRSGRLKYFKNNMSTEIDVEISGISDFDFLVFTERLNKWSNGEIISEDDKKLILNSFKKWAKNKHYRCQW